MLEYYRSQIVLAPMCVDADSRRHFALVEGGEELTVNQSNRENEFHDGRLSARQVFEATLPVFKSALFSKSANRQFAFGNHRQRAGKVIPAVGVRSFDLDFASDHGAAVDLRFAPAQSDPDDNSAGRHAAHGVRTTLGLPHRIDREIGPATLSPSE